ncbi:regulatory protein RecX [Streptomyces sp. AC495_CC817]|uniref:regulatory protein RecX n=1 Tax=Streptomyces sp. AC495_CC817 TaxID=2823900 RepID=UPI001C2771D4|nr:regulatory protein RecX [Streptomyces sp. AC495_CC817]
MGDDAERIAPVIPLFGGGSRGTDSAGHLSRAEEIVPRRTGDAGLWRSTWDDDDRDEIEHSSARHPAHGTDKTAPRLRALQTDLGEERPSSALDEGEVRDAAEELLIRKLRAKSLSVSEARSVLRGFETQGQRVDAAQIEDIIDGFTDRGYLDDATLAWHLVTSGVERKGQGRVALARGLAQRGIPRDVIDEALSELPDDDADRALEFARSKARSMSSLDHDTALRRLVGQLARRGYNGGVAMTAAKTALAENAVGRPSTGVRFVDSD